jgi:hypothetical protein
MGFAPAGMENTMMTKGNVRIAIPIVRNVYGQAPTALLAM